MKYILIIIPHLSPMPILSEDPENPPTSDKLLALEEWEQKNITHQEIITYVNGLPFIGKYSQVIDVDAPVKVKGDKKYFIYCLNQKRSVVENFDQFLKEGIQQISIDISNLVKQNEIIIVSTENPTGWLISNEYVDINFIEGMR